MIVSLSNGLSALKNEFLQELLVTDINETIKHLSDSSVILFCWVGFKIQTVKSGQLGYVEAGNILHFFREVQAHLLVDQICHFELFG